MNKVYIKCKATDCLHHAEEQETCIIGGSSPAYFIDINSKGECLDYSSLTEKERDFLLRDKEKPIEFHEEKPEEE